MSRGVRIAALGLLSILAAWGCWSLSSKTPGLSLWEPYAWAADAVPVKGMVTLVDLGAGACIPCKMMAPILEKLERTYERKAAIVFLDVWKDQAPAKRFGIRAIPTQIFFDKKGKEVYRHVGFMSEEAIVAQLKSMGVE